MAIAEQGPGGDYPVPSNSRVRCLQVLRLPEAHHKRLRIDQAYSDLKATCGGVRNDYFALIYLEREFQVERDDAVASELLY